MCSSRSYVGGFSRLGGRVFRGFWEKVLRSIISRGGFAGLFVAFFCRSLFGGELLGFVLKMMCATFCKRRFY